MIIVPNHGEGDGLAYFVNKAAPENLVMCLFVNNYTPIETSQTSSFVEASGAGYNPITLTGATWTVTEANPSEATYPQQTFTFTGSLGSVYGYFMRRVTSGRIAYAERFTDGPYQVSISGDQIKITPRITLD